MQPATLRQHKEAARSVMVRSECAEEDEQRSDLEFPRSYPETSLLRFARNDAMIWSRFGLGRIWPEPQEFAMTP
jgi:hypothetical protein